MNGDGPGEMDLLAACAFGTEAVVARELEQLGYDARGVGTGRVAFRGDGRALCDTNLWLRAADRVLVRLGASRVGGGDEGFEALFQGIKGIAWERWVSRTAAFPVAARCVRSAITSEPAVQRAAKRAIAERLGAVYGTAGSPAELPETGAPVRIEVSLLRDEATVTLDASGVGLHKRGYRQGPPGEAAVKETLAAALVQLSVWRPGRALVDPFCGSGTIAIEAALIGRNIAPGLVRAAHAPDGGGFDFLTWEDPARPGERLVAPETWAEAVEEARAAVVAERLDPVIHASDTNEAALDMARRNARAAGFDVERDIQFIRRDFKDLASRLEYGVVLTNPPYGVRLGEARELEQLYRSMPAVLRKLPTWSFHIFTGRLDMERLFGQEATRRRKLYNSTIECALFTFLGPRPPGVKGFEAASDEGAKGDAVEAVGMADREEEAGGAAAVEPPTADADGDTAGDGAEGGACPPRREREEAGPVFGGLRERDTREAAEFARCLANNLRHLRKYPARGITCYRVYERDVPDVPLIVDRYDDRYHVAEYERRHSRSAAQQADWFDLMRRTVAETAGVPVEHVYIKEKHRQKGLTQHEKVGAAQHTRVVTEGTPPLKFEVNLSDYIDTGLFLDHRLTRQMVREQAAGKRFLNLFCYTGSFTVYAAAGGASETTSVDLSNTYLAWAERNLTLNGLKGPRHRLVRSDVLEFLRSVKRAPGGVYDLAVVDPPTFSNSKSTGEDWEVAAGHSDVLRLLGPLMSPGGVVYFSSNFRRFKFDESAAVEAGFAAVEISRRTVPPEYRNRRVHVCWRLVQVGREEAGRVMESRKQKAESSNEEEDGEKAVS